MASIIRFPALVPGPNSTELCSAPDIIFTAMAPPACATARLKAKLSSNSISYSPNMSFTAGRSSGDKIMDAGSVSADGLTVCKRRETAIDYGVISILGCQRVVYVNECTLRPSGKFRSPCSMQRGRAQYPATTVEPYHQGCFSVFRGMMVDIGIAQTMGKGAGRSVYRRRWWRGLQRS